MLMSGTLLERDHVLSVLQDALRRAVRGHGVTVLVHGEAGIGKSALVDAFARRQREVRLLRGACEALFTPRPLGPLRDIAVELGGKLLRAVESGSRDGIFDACLGALADQPGPVLWVIEDLHWADEATFDLLKFLGRRIAGLPVMIVATHRDDEPEPAGQRLQRAFGDLPSAAVVRVGLEALSEDAVAALARSAGRGAEGLYSLTGGNPFYVTELLGNHADTTPSSISAAVLARTARLEPAGRELLDLVSVVPGACEVWLLQSICGTQPEGLAACLDAGMLVHRLGAYAFRHELARLAVVEALPAGRLQQLNAKVMHALLGRDAVLHAGRIVHHAAAAGAGEVVLRYGPPAAEDAARVGAHREAAAFYARALAYVDALPLREQAHLHERHSFECYVTDQHDAAFNSRDAALRLWRQMDDPVRSGDSLRWLSRLSWCRGRHAEAGEFGRQALEVLDALPPSRELAYALSNLAQLAMLANDAPACTRHGRRALQLAREFDDVEIQVHALNNLGTTTWGRRDPAGRAMLEESLQLAIMHDMQEHAARAYTNLAFQAGCSSAFALAEPYYEAGIRYCEDRELDFWAQYMRACRSQVWLDQGRWPAAEEEARTLLAARRLAPISKITALTVLARILVRTGAGRVTRLLHEAADLASRSGDLIRIAPVACARAEAAWLAGHAGQVQALIEPAYRHALALKDYWFGGEPAWWLSRGGVAGLPGFEVHEPWALQITGRYREAADAWQRLGCPYHEAVARLECGDRKEIEAALAIFEALGARPLAQQARGLLRPSKAARPRSHPGKLTRRQSEVLAHLAQGLSNARIAERMFISAKTVDHHLQAVFAALGVGSRTEAVAEARRRGWLDSENTVASANGENGENSR
jgi:DNA-binding CsgD family transcriptional regulator